MLQLIKEPFVYFSKLMYLIYCIALMHSLRYDKHTFICRLTQSCIYIIYFKFLILYEAMHTLTYHSQALLYSFFKITANSHNFTNRLHAGTKFTVNATELTQVPAWYFTNHIVKGRFKKCACSLCH